MVRTVSLQTLINVLKRIHASILITRIISFKFQSSLLYVFQIFGTRLFDLQSLISSKQSLALNNTRL